jgi:hypothetical protein
MVRRGLVVGLATLAMLPLGVIGRGRTAEAAAAVSVTVTPATKFGPVSPLIYGGNPLNLFSPEETSSLYTVERWGGDLATRYNWQLNAFNSGGDYFYLGYPGNGPDATHDRFLATTKQHHQAQILTVPMIGWSPKSTDIMYGYSMSKYGVQQDSECAYVAQNDPANLVIVGVPPFYCHPDAGNGLDLTGAPILSNDPHDTSQEVGPPFVTAWMRDVVRRYGTSTAGGVKFVALDNEPMLWHYTHQDVRSTFLTYDELWQKTVDYAGAVKAVDPSVQILGPVSSGWCEYFTSTGDFYEDGNDTCTDGPDRAAHGGVALTPWYLKKVCDNQKVTGKRLVDYLDVHYYPAAGNIAFSTDESPDASALRLRSVKALYDPTYREEVDYNNSFYADSFSEAPQVIPRMKNWIAQNCPGMKLAITEYNFGESEPTGALTQAEALAIFGRYGVDMATRWVDAPAGNRIEDAFKLYLNYNGAGAKVTGDAVAAVSSNKDQVGSYAIQNANGTTYVLLFNKATEASPVTVNLGGHGGKQVELFGFDADNALQRTGTMTASASGLALTLPARSATLAVVH